MNKSFQSSTLETDDSLSDIYLDTVLYKLQKIIKIITFHSFLPMEIEPLGRQYSHTSFSASLGAPHLTGPEQNRRAGAWDCGYIASTLPF